MLSVVMLSVFMVNVVAPLKSLREKFEFRLKKGNFLGQSWAIFSRHASSSFGATAFSIMAHSIMTFSIMAHSITTFSIMTFIIMTFSTNDI